ncbi:hypothetical protein GDS87_06655 [Lysinibacillus pakistanensis]|uniref:Uncharacterized protein n=1 Tax=Lysinibacillus pakistanensis TaxID=759811 RepID=A0ABX6DAK4_9BACI|nr:hypothetical protein GDS87_06655 [Lysinibacillus pakistanensis]
MSEETSIISNFYFSSINKILNQKNENNKNILYYTKDRLNDDLEQNSPFELYMLAQTLENEKSNNDVLDEFSADVRNYIEKNNTSSPIQIFYLSKLNKLFSSKQEKKIANLLEKQVPLLLEEDSSEEFKETIRLFSDIIENNLIKTSQKINLKDYDIKKYFNT